MANDGRLRITLAAARVNAGMNQKEAAQRMGVSSNTILSWEKGTSPIKAMQLQKLCGIYGLTMDDIFLPNAAT